MSSLRAPKKKDLDRKASSNPARLKLTLHVAPLCSISREGGHGFLGLKWSRTG
jgi:hypothetical protein